MATTPTATTFQQLRQNWATLNIRCIISQSRLILFGEVVKQLKPPVAGRAPGWW